MSGRAVLVVSLFLVILATGCGRQGAEPGERRAVEQSKRDVGPRGAPKVAAKLQGIRLDWQEAGKPKMIAKAARASGSTAPGTASLAQVTADLYSGGRPVARLTAPIVDADERTRTVTASGGVTVKSLDMNSAIQVLKAARVTWLARKDRLVGEGGVTAVGPRASLRASAFAADTRMRTVRLTADPGEARAEVGPP
jgi:hypothetical protein